MRTVTLTIILPLDLFDQIEEVRHTVNRQGSDWETPLDRDTFIQTLLTAGVFDALEVGDFTTAPATLRADA